MRCRCPMREQLTGVSAVSSSWIVRLAQGRLVRRRAAMHGHIGTLRARE